VSAEKVMSSGATLPKPAWRGMTVVCAVLAAVLLVASARYGYHRDELYFIVCGQHLAWSYPDQGVLTPLIASSFEALGHGSLVVFRLPAVASVVGTAWLTGLTARELGGRTPAQVLATLTVAVSTVGLLAGHLVSTATLDLAVWVAITWVVLRIARTGRTRLWMVAGALVGVGLLNKDLVLVLVLSLTLGLFTVPGGRGLVFNRWYAIGALIAVAAWVPGLVWQAQHGWPQVEIARMIRDEYGTAGQRIGFVVLQIFLFSLGASVLWLTGAIGVWRDPRWRFARVLAVSGLVAFVLFVITAGQAYYTVGVYPALIAAGAVVVERRPRMFWTMAVVVVVTSALTLPASLPILPPRTLAASGWAGGGEQQLEMVGWPREVGLVASAYRSIPAARRSQAVILTANYGEAGAIDRYRASFGLPEAYSGLNAFGLWGPPPASGRPIVLVWEDLHPPTYLVGCRYVRRVGGPVPNEEHDYARIFVCVGPRGTWASIWPHVAHLSN
jgi:4-amino-4-deoxy-L-arabinose transferase-like glycosyltransferase